MAVGIVVVSHSRALAQAAVALAREVAAGGNVAIEVAAGLDEHTFGTDAVAVMTAITGADERAGSAGVVVLMDLGSAVLSAELALELLDDDGVRSRVILCAAPLVEGLVAAAVTAAGGADRDSVAAQAMAGLAAKQAHLGGPAAARQAPRTVEPELTVRFTVGLPHGLHARPAARIVQAAATFDADVHLRNLTTGAGPVPARSLTQVAALGVLAGHEVEACASGPAAAQALEAIQHLAAGNDLVLTGLTASPGNATGPVWLRPAVPADLEVLAVPVPDTATGDPAADWQAMLDAVAAARRDVTSQRDRVAATVGPAEAAIFQAHLLLLEDAVLLDDVHRRIDPGGCAPAAAWAAATAAVETMFTAVADPYLRARADDVRALRDQVLRHLVGLPAAEPLTAAHGVVVAAELTPAEAADLDPARVVAVVLAGGSPVTHSAILLRAKAIPTVVGVGPHVLALPQGTLVTVEAGVEAGEVILAPAAVYRVRRMLKDEPESHD